MKRLWILAALVIGSANSASAAVIVSNAGVGLDSSGAFNWQYVVTLQPDQTLQTGDFFTVYDVPNILFDGSNPEVLFSANPGATYSTEVSLITAPDLLPAFNDPAINDIKVTLISPTSLTTGTGALILGTLTIKSSLGLDFAVSTDYAAQAGLVPGNPGDPIVPSISTGTVNVAQVPEPSVTLMMLGLVAFGAIALRRRRLS